MGLKNRTMEAISPLMPPIPTPTLPLKGREHRSCDCPEKVLEFAPILPSLWVCDTASLFLPFKRKRYKDLYKKSICKTRPGVLLAGFVPFQRNTFI